MYMYVAGVHSLRPLDGNEFNPSSLCCRLVSSFIERGVCVVLYDELKLEDELKLGEW